MWRPGNDAFIDLLWCICMRKKNLSAHQRQGSTGRHAGRVSPAGSVVAFAAMPQRLPLATRNPPAGKARAWSALRRLGENGKKKSRSLTGATGAAFLAILLLAILLLAILLTTDDCLRVATWGDPCIVRHSHDGQTSVHPDHLTGDKRRVVACKKPGKRGHIRRRAGAA